MAKKIGCIDYYLDEWHANNYPAWIEKASGGAYTVAYAYGEIDSPLGGKTTAQWCDAMHVERCESIDALIEKSDCIIVLSPDNPKQHWALCQKPLRSGKRVYVDKTFAPTAQIARDRALAEENAKKLAGVVVQVQARAGQGGRLFGAVTSQEISDALREQHGIEIEKNRIVQPEPIKQFGSYEVKAKLGSEVSGTINVLVTEKK